MRKASLVEHSHAHRSPLHVSPKCTSPESCRLTSMEDTRAAALYFQPTRLTKGEHIGKRGKIQSTPRRRRHGPGGWGGVVGREMSLKTRNDRWPQGGGAKPRGEERTSPGREEARHLRAVLVVCEVVTAVPTTEEAPTRVGVKPSRRPHPRQRILKTATTKNIETELHTRFIRA